MDDRQRQSRSSGRGRRERAAGNFHGRRKAKALKPAQQAAMQTVLPRLAIDIATPCPEPINGLFDPPAGEAGVILEIGFGGGEHLLREAARHPRTGFLGCEPFVNGMAKAVRAIAQSDPGNVRLFSEDATLLLDWLPDQCLERVYLLYPDPWPKKRHWKRRFVNAGNLVRFHRVLKPGGEFRFASDIDSYVNWTLRHLMDHGGFEWTARTAHDWHEPWEDWQSTRYEQKAIREGRKPAYFIFARR